MPLLRALTLTFALTGLALATADGQNASDWVHESWTVKDGLPVNSINGILQDRAGYRGGGMIGSTR